MSGKGKRKRHCLKYFNERRRENNKIRRLERLKRKAVRMGWGEKFIQQLTTAIARCEDLKRTPRFTPRAITIVKKEDKREDRWH